jgi:hypothetical protein
MVSKIMKMIALTLLGFKLSMVVPIPMEME